MNITSNFNRFYHRAVLTELFRKCGTLKFELWVDSETGGVFEFIKGEHFNDMDDLKQILKNMNVDYAVNEDKKISTADIDSKALMQHIDYCIMVAGQNNISFGFIEDEWERLLNQAYNYQGDKMRFKEDSSVSCGGNMGTKEEQIVRLESNIKTRKARLKGYKEDKKALKRMYNKGYSYNHNHLHEIIGSCFIEIDKAKGGIEDYKEQLSKLKKANNAN